MSNDQARTVIVVVLPPKYHSWPAGSREATALEARGFAPIATALPEGAEVLRAFTDEDDKGETVWRVTYALPACPNCGHAAHDNKRCAGTTDEDDWCACSWPDPGNFTSYEPPTQGD